MHHGIGHTLPSTYPPTGHTCLLLVTSGGDHWRTVQTCSLEDIPQLVLTSSGGHRSGQYASYWNAFLFALCALHSDLSSDIMKQHRRLFFGVTVVVKNIRVSHRPTEAPQPPRSEEPHNNEQHVVIILTENSSHFCNWYS